MKGQRLESVRVPSCPPCGRHAGSSNSSATFRDPQREHLSLVARSASGKSAPRVQMSVSRSERNVRLALPNRRLPLPAAPRAVGGDLHAAVAGFAEGLDHHREQMQNIISKVMGGRPNDDWRLGTRDQFVFVRSFSRRFCLERLVKIHLPETEIASDIPSVNNFPARFSGLRASVPYFGSDEFWSRRYHTSQCDLATLQTEMVDELASVFQKALPLGTESSTLCKTFP